MNNMYSLANPELCISFCEVSHILFRKTDEILDDIMSRISCGYSGRVYVGSNFCSRYFLRYAKQSIEILTKLSLLADIKITLCIPIFTQVNIDNGKDTVQELLMNYSDYIDEITVNDYGMLSFIRGITGKSINIGRLMNKNTRDIREDSYFNKSYTYYDNSFFDAITRKYNIERYECDMTNRFIDLRMSKNKYAFYFPYVYATTGNICEYSGIGNRIEDKFRANIQCQYQCTKTFIKYSHPDSEYYKFGNTVYFPVRDFEIYSSSPYRLIYEPFDSVVGRNHEKYE